MPMPMSQQFWVPSLHLPKQWNLREADEAVLKKVLNKYKKTLFEMEKF
jgi:hypothetical protein